MTSMVDETPQLSCYTAPGVLFESPQALREHYKTDWHRYNLKRKVAGLPPISSLSFQKRREAALKLREKAAVPSKGASHLSKSKKDKKQRQKNYHANKKKALPTTPGTEGEGEGEGETKTTAGPAVNTESIDIEKVTASQLRRAANATFSIFDSHQCPTVEENMEYMFTKYNFQLPDTKYIDDLDGMIKYCVAKVRLGRMCLYCEKGFSTVEGCQQHMKDQNHCRLPVSNEDNYFDEYGEYYDFSSETDSREQRNIEMMDNGELVISDKDGKNAKIIGTREFKHVYDQNVKVEDERDSVSSCCSCCCGCSCCFVLSMVVGHVVGQWFFFVGRLFNACVLIVIFCAFVSQVRHAKAQSKAKLMLMCERLGINTRTSSDGTLMKYVKMQSFHRKGELKMLREVEKRKGKMAVRQGTINNLLQKNSIAGMGARFALGVGVHG